MEKITASENQQSFLAKALQTPEAKEALGEGFAALLTTGDADKAWQAIIATGQRNGSLAVAQVAFLLDLLKAIADLLRNRQDYI